MSPYEATEGRFVWLNGSDYRVRGIIASRFNKFVPGLTGISDECRVVVQCLEPGGLLLIANPARCDPRKQYE